MQTLFSIIAIVISVISLVTTILLAVRGWWRQRSVYSLERKLFFRHPNPPNDNRDLLNKLSSGNFNIIHAQEYGGQLEIILGEIKRSNKKNPPRS
jgi:hypothetical protein